MTGTASSPQQFLAGCTESAIHLGSLLVMRQPEQCPSKVADIPHRVQKDGWWLVVDNTIPCTGKDRRRSGLTLVITRGADHNHAGSGHDDHD